MANRFRQKSKLTPNVKNIAQEEARYRFGDRKLCVITGTSSGLGRSTLNHLTKKTDEYHVICAVRDVTKMEVIAEVDEIPLDKISIIPVI